MRWQGHKKIPWQHQSDQLPFSFSSVREGRIFGSQRKKRDQSEPDYFPQSLQSPLSHWVSTQMAHITFSQKHGGGKPQQREQAHGVLRGGQMGSEGEAFRVQRPRQHAWNTESRRPQSENFGVLVLSKCRERIYKLTLQQASKSNTACLSC